MKTEFFLVFFGLMAEMYLSNGIVENSGVEVPQSLVLNLFPFNDSDKQYPHDTTQEPSRESPSPSVSFHNFIEKSNNFGFNLYRKIALKHDNNIFFSPLSLSFALAIFLLASEGETHHQISQSLNLTFMKEKDEQFLTLFQQLRLNITQNEEFTFLQNSVSFIQEDFQIKDVFHNLSKRYFDMEFLSVDFRNSTLAKKIVNEHIKKKTRGKIPILFHAFDQHAKIILMNYILFRGKWLHPFSAKLTQMETFYIDNYRTVQVPMMFKTDRIASTFDKTLQCYVLKLPYKGSVQMLIVMPVKEADYMFVEDQLTNELVESWFKTMKIRKMDIYLPNFKLDQTYHMDQLLQDLGVKDLFSYKADLSHLTNQRFVKISQDWLQCLEDLLQLVVQERVQCKLQSTHCISGKPLYLRFLQFCHHPEQRLLHSRHLHPGSHRCRLSCLVWRWSVLCLAVLSHCTLHGLRAIVPHAAGRRWGSSTRTATLLRSPRTSQGHALPQHLDPGPAAGRRR